ncbi:MAG TPA: ribonuclease HIII, partial [Chondromyces sp.]|nr:ribonuclease HIII [Chondromyces sp.]
MGNTVLKVSNETMGKMINYYQPFSTGKIPQGGVFAAKPPGCSVTAYKSGKVLFQGKTADEEAAKWQGETSVPNSGTNPKSSGSALPQGFSDWSVIGSDEVGTGDYFGPMTVVSAYVKKEEIALLKELGVRDSKNLTDTQISIIAKQITKIIPYSLLILKNDKYNELQQKGMSQGKMKALLHNQAILKLQEKIAPEKPEAILIDQFAEKATYYRYLEGQRHICKEDVYFSTKGESVHIAVAAASIIAR